MVQAHACTDHPWRIQAAVADLRQTDGVLPAIGADALVSVIFDHQHAGRLAVFPAATGGRQPFRRIAELRGSAESRTVLHRRSLSAKEFINGDSCALVLEIVYLLWPELR